MAPKAMTRGAYYMGAGDVVDIGGYFPVNGSSSPVAGSRNGAGWSVARTATGKYKVTLTDRFQGYEFFYTQIQKSTADADVAKPGLVTLNDSGKTTMEITTLVSGSAADIAAATGTNIQFLIRVWKGKRTPVRG